MRLGCLVAAALLVLVAGCNSSTSNPAGSVSPLAADPPRFAAPMLLDTVRAGGEPVIAVTHAGTILVSSHPGFTHYFQGAPADTTHLLQDYSGQVYMWRSTDNGTTWTPVGAPVSIPGTPAGYGPRSTGFGVSDPDFTVMPDGAICYTDLEALAAASVSCSLDDGRTWAVGNSAASGQPVDRQWLASYGNELYFTANPEGGADPADFRVSTDHGLTWTDRGTSPCNSDVVADPRTGHLLQGCGAGMTVSDDGGRTWSPVRAPDGAGNAGLSLNEPAIDGAGTVWIAWSDGERNLRVAGTKDEGVHWPYQLELAPQFVAYAQAHGNTTRHNGTFVWPWISAGSAGRLAVTWIGTYGDKPSPQNDGPWFVFTAFVLGADATPDVVVERLTPTPMHVGPICQSGTLCEAGAAQGQAASDRRLGDLFETTIEPHTGYLLATWANTVQQPDVISHPQFVRQVGGMRLVADNELASLVPTQG